jgi:hypothetical protein
LSGDQNGTAPDGPDRRDTGDPFFRMVGLDTTPVMASGLFDPSAAKKANRPFLENWAVMLTDKVNPLMSLAIMISLYINQPIYISDRLPEEDRFLGAISVAIQFDDEKNPKECRLKLMIKDEERSPRLYTTKTVTLKIKRDGEYRMRAYSESIEMEIFKIRDEVSLKLGDRDSLRLRRVSIHAPA